MNCLTDDGYLRNDDQDESLDDNLKGDKSKIRREKAKFSAKEKERKYEINRKGIECIGADGKRDRKSVIRKAEIINGLQMEKTCKGTEEHITYTTEPEGQYLTHSTVTNGSGKGLLTIS